MVRRHRTSLTVKVSLGLIMIVLFISIVNMQLTLKERRTECEELREQVLDAKDAIEEKKYRLAEEVDEEYIMRFAREKLGYRLPNELIFINDIAN